MSVLEASLCPMERSIALECRAKEALRGTGGCTRREKAGRRRQEGEGKENERGGGRGGHESKREEGEEERSTG